VERYCISVILRANVGEKSSRSPNPTPLETIPGPALE